MNSFRALVLFYFVFNFATATAQTKIDQAESLKTILDFADHLCQTVPLTTSSDRVELSGSAQAELAGLIKRLTNLGVAGAAKYERATTRNVLQKDLAEVLRDSRNCRLQVWNDLKVRMLGLTSGPQQPRPPAEIPNARPVAVASPKTKLTRSAGAATSPPVEPIQLTCGDLRGTKLVQTMQLDRSKYIYPDRTLEDWFLQNIRPASVNQSPEDFRLASVYHILTDSEAAANEVLQRLVAGDCFSALAKRYSIDVETKNQTGRLHKSNVGSIAIDSLPTAVANAVRRLRKDEYSSTPVESSIGWHVIAVTDKE